MIARKVPFERTHARAPVQFELLIRVVEMNLLAGRQSSWEANDEEAAVGGVPMIRHYVHLAAAESNASNRRDARRHPRGGRGVFGATTTDTRCHVMYRQRLRPACGSDDTESVSGLEVRTDLGHVEHVGPARSALSLLELHVGLDNYAPPVPARFARHFVFVAHHTGMPGRGAIDIAHGLRAARGVEPDHAVDHIVRELVQGPSCEVRTDAQRREGLIQRALQLRRHHALRLVHPRTEVAVAMHRS